MSKIDGDWFDAKKFNLTADLSVTKTKSSLSLSSSSWFFTKVLKGNICFGRIEISEEKLNNW